MTRILTILGARPQFIKAAALSRAFQKTQGIEETIVHTGQHFDANMSDIFFEELHLPRPKYAFNINGGTHGQMTGRMLEAIDDVLVSEKPEAVLVYGDTNSTLAGALSASKQQIPVIHIEAGLRSSNKAMPEEINRILTDHVSSLLFCPTSTAVGNLKNEGIEAGIHHVGDVMYDATLYAIEHIKLHDTYKQKFSFLPQKFIFMTIHRAESTQTQEIFSKLMSFAQEFSSEHNVEIIFPVHPRIKKLIASCASRSNKKFIFVDPLSYFETQYCLSKASHILTDSGGLQKEAYFHRVPCVTLRNETEWIETIEYGWNCLWGDAKYCSRKNILEYGDGQCAEKIARIIKEEL
ncbi:MAG: UDP-N-acetylglucosamine 2-epimerase (non-hydrolyzing) [Proteobacteria bacterium]|nr:UDP-N-acetylglucosamine 2-epimerase (non-hydrolyzing) [Pseudomonadota bacterium]